MNSRFFPLLLCAVISPVLIGGCNKNTAVSEKNTESDTVSDLQQEIEILRNDCVVMRSEIADLRSLMGSYTVVQESTESPLENTQEKIDSDAFIMPDVYRIRGVPKLSQLPDYPTGCESVSAVMLLQYSGNNISVDTFIDKYLSKSDDFYHKNGVCYGPNPCVYFIGNPRKETSYGCMAPVIENAFLSYFDSDEQVCNTSGTPLPQLCADYICKGIPVMVWTSMKMEAPRPGSTWHLEDGSEYQWLANEHCMVLVGYDETYYYFNDPYKGSEVRYKKEITEQRYAAFEMQSLTLLKNT